MLTEYANIAGNWAPTLNAIPNPEADACLLFADANYSGSGAIRLKGYK